MLARREHPFDDSALAAGLALVELPDSDAGAGADEIPGARAASDRGIVIGIDRTGTLPDVAPARFDVLLTTAAHALRPWVAVSPDALDVLLAALRARAGRHIRRRPQCSPGCCESPKVCRSPTPCTSNRLPIPCCSAAVSFAPGAAAGHNALPSESGRPRVALFRSGDDVTVRLTRPERTQRLRRTHA